MLLEDAIKEQEEMDMSTTRIEAEEPDAEQLYTVESILEHRYDKCRLLFEGSCTNMKTQAGSQS